MGGWVWPSGWGGLTRGGVSGVEGLARGWQVWGRGSGTGGGYIPKCGQIYT